MLIDLLEHFAFTFTFCLIVKTSEALLLLSLKLQICHTGGHAWILVLSLIAVFLSSFRHVPK